MACRPAGTTIRKRTPTHMSHDNPAHDPDLEFLTLDPADRTSPVDEKLMLEEILEGAVGQHLTEEEKKPLHGTCAAALLKESILFFTDDVDHPIHNAITILACDVRDRLVDLTAPTGIKVRFTPTASMDGGHPVDLDPPYGRDGVWEMVNADIDAIVAQIEYTEEDGRVVPIDGQGEFFSGYGYSIIHSAYADVPDWVRQWPRTGRLEIVDYVIENEDGAIDQAVADKLDDLIEQREQMMLAGQRWS